MALYLGNKKVNLLVGNAAAKLNIFVPSTGEETSGVKLLTSNNEILKDFNNCLLIIKEGE